MPQATWDTTVQIMLDAGLISAPPSEGAWRGDLTEAAWALLADSGVDLSARASRRPSSRSRRAANDRSLSS